jgi:hypothetical protein
MDQLQTDGEPRRRPQGGHIDTWHLQGSPHSVEGGHALGVQAERCNAWRTEGEYAIQGVKLRFKMYATAINLIECIPNDGTLEA